ncbi:uncharacterized protein LOC111383007 isoform X1 [Olea europaea var. sylvestris]|uniref:uncharacterized protein LOC111383007 isoform X1 n=1 Tax=Olea europaea var. sylvestris TaxID=158386 RepID=UPI000C1D324F|nr:uncharacterized protein LOC111383007 isoform X1 [Olea europaea var. sylvestris]
METKKIIAICQSGGEFVANKDNGLLSYTGGEAYALSIDEKTQLKDFKQELSENFQCNVDGMTIKYFLPGNRKTLITISKNKDLQRMLNFFKDSDQVEVFVACPQNVPNMPASRSSRTTVSEAVIPSDDPMDIMQDDDAIVLNEPIESLPLKVTPFSNDEKHRRAATQWENIITGVDQRFNSFAEFREALHKYSIAHGFDYKYKKNDNHRVTAKCKMEGCPWRIYASRVAATQLICIKIMNAEHTCGGATIKARQATKGWIGSIIKEKLKVSPNYKPKDIAKEIERDYGIQLNYSQARRAKEFAREQLQGSYEEAYSHLPFFCEKIMETNPGSLATLTTREDSSFHRLFVSFHASISGFHQCRPLIFLDSTLLYSKYQGILLAATAADGNDDFFPVAFAVVDEETEDNWHWFLSELKSTFSTSEHITFVSDFQKGIRESLLDIFGKECYHGYCLRCLAEKLNKDVKGLSHDARRLLVQDLYAAAYSAKLEAFERCLENIKAISAEAYDWVIGSEPEHWSNAFFGGTRYNHMTSNFGQQFYSWVSEVDGFPITQMVDVLRGKIMELMYRRRLESSHWVTRLTPCMEEKLQNETAKVQSLQVLQSIGNSTFEVRGESVVDLVDVDKWDCSCKGWQLTGLPCSHAIAVFECVGRTPYDYCSRYFMTDTYRLTYMESINPIPNVEKPEKSEVFVTPPPTKRRVKPKVKPVELMDSIKRQLQCRRCKGLGHNTRTCDKVNNNLLDEEAHTLTPLLTGMTTDEPTDGGNI